MKDIISQLMQNNGVSGVLSVSCVEMHKKHAETNGYTEEEFETPQYHQGVASVSNPDLQHLLHRRKPKVFHEKFNKINDVTPETPETPYLNHNGQNALQTHGEPSLSFAFYWHLQELRKVHGYHLSEDFLEAIAFDRTQWSWIQQNFPPLEKYNEEEVTRRMADARAALISAGIKPCKPLEDITERTKYP